MSVCLSVCVCVCVCVLLVAALVLRRTHTHTLWRRCRRRNEKHGRPRWNLVNHWQRYPLECCSLPSTSLPSTSLPLSLLPLYVSLSLSRVLYVWHVEQSFSLVGRDSSRDSAGRLAFFYRLSCVQTARGASFFSSSSSSSSSFFVFFFVSTSPPSASSRSRPPHTHTHDS